MPGAIISDVPLGCSPPAQNKVNRRPIHTPWDTIHAHYLVSRFEFVHTNLGCCLRQLHLIRVPLARALRMEDSFSILINVQQYTVRMTGYAVSVDTRYTHSTLRHI